VLGAGLNLTLRRGVAGAPRVEEIHETGLASPVRGHHRAQHLARMFEHVRSHFGIEEKGT